MAQLFLRKTKMDEDEFDENHTFHINYQRVIDEKSMLSITRLLASQMMKNPYVIVGDYLKDMSDSDLNMLNSIIEYGEHHDNFEDLMLISEMLATGEGLERGTMEIMHQRINQFLMFITCESLFRKGLIKLHRENMSFGDDMSHLIVAEKLDD
jgi:hypothetical protein